MIHDEEKLALIKYRIDQAEKSIVTVSLLIEAKDFNAAVSRIKSL
jgi:hypothetical protein